MIKSIQESFDNYPTLEAAQKAALEILNAKVEDTPFIQPGETVILPWGFILYGLSNNLFELYDPHGAVKVYSAPTRRAQ
jgi:hypothetical protein